MDESMSLLEHLIFSFLVLRARDTVFRNPKKIGNFLSKTTRINVL